MKATTKATTLTTINAAMDALLTNPTFKARRRVVAQRGSTFVVCSRSKARRLGLKMVARNY